MNDTRDAVLKLKPSENAANELVAKRMQQRTAFVKELQETEEGRAVLEFAETLFEVRYKNWPENASTEFKANVSKLARIFGYLPDNTRHSRISVATDYKWLQKLTYFMATL